MAIAGYAIGARHGYIYIRAEYPIAVERLEHAIKQVSRLRITRRAYFNLSFFIQP